MLIALLGLGKGLQNGVAYEFRDDAVNSIWVYPGQTSIPFKGLQPGRYVQFTNQDYGFLKDQVEGVEHLSARFYIRGTVTVTYKQEYGAYDVRSVHPGHQFLENTIVKEGRFINDLDIRDFRKVVAIGEPVKNDLFKNEEAVGKFVKINGISFRVVGIFKDEGGENEERNIYLPISTAQRTFNGGNKVNQLMFTVGDATLEESQAMVKTLTNDLAKRHNFAPDDARAVRIRNNIEGFQQFMDLMGGIQLFITVIGVLTLMAGVIGVGNIMLVVVKERTKEIGIRKALGATPMSIIGMIVMEAVVITMVAGYIGMFLGILFLDNVGSLIPPDSFFREPEVKLSVAIKSTLLLVVAGGLAGLFPALKASRIRPIEALRDE
jgi:putative ABC transport system permease protein